MFMLSNTAQCLRLLTRWRSAALVVLGLLALITSVLAGLRTSADAHIAST